MYKEDEEYVAEAIEDSIKVLENTVLVMAKLSGCPLAAEFVRLALVDLQTAAAHAKARR